MGFWDWLFRRLDIKPEVVSGPRPNRRKTGLDANELANRLGISVDQLRSIHPTYHRFNLPKRSGRPRRISAPVPQLKELQRRALKRVLRRLRVHPAVMGFERGRSIVHNAAAHVGSAVVVRMDLREFFPTTTTDRVRRYLSFIGWDQEAADLLTDLCTLEGGLPQGAPTSPRLSNLVNYTMDARLAGLAKKVGAVYTRYADDITFSFPVDNHDLIAGMIGSVKAIVHDYGYRLHHRRKLSIRRRHQNQRVTGLVVNEHVALPRQTRRRLRAVRHKLATGQRATMTAEQLAGWDAFEHMIATQAADVPGVSD